jgi:hypothetical protein
MAEHLGVASAALSRPRRELIDRGLIEAAGHGALRFTIPGFATYLRDQALIESSEVDPRAAEAARLARSASSPLADAPRRPSPPTAGGSPRRHHPDLGSQRELGL